MMKKPKVKNRNYQSPLKFDLSIDKLVDFNYFVYRVNIPSLTINSVTTTGGTPFVNIPWLGDHVQYSEMSVDFKVSEGLYNWYELYDWMRGISYPTKQREYGDLKLGKNKNLDGDPKSPLPPVGVHGHLYSQGTLTVNTSHNNPFVKVNFVDLHPVGLSELVFDSQLTDVDYLSCTVTFKYDYYVVERVR